MVDGFEWDHSRSDRTGIFESVYCEGKAVSDLESIALFHIDRGARVLFTRLDAVMFDRLSKSTQSKLQYNKISHTAYLNVQDQETKDLGIGIVCAGTSDMRIAAEVKDTLYFYGIEAELYSDIGVAGIWRLFDRLESIKKKRLLIALAGMEGAIFSVLSGLVSAPVIAVPTSVGYGVNEGGNNALTSALGSCSDGVLTTNIDNGYGAAIAAIKILHIK